MRGQGYVLKTKWDEWVLCEGLLRVWCVVRERSPCHVVERCDGVDRGSTLTEKCSFRINNKILHAHTD